MSKKIFLIDGASGTGKSDIIKYIEDFRTNAISIKKYTTRKARKYEKELSNDKLDLKHINIAEFNKKKLDYVYKYAGNMYGFNKLDINKALKENDAIFIIVRDIKTMKQIKLDYKHYNVITIFVYTDTDKIINRLMHDNLSKEDIRLRLGRLEVAYKSYLANSLFYDEIIINSGTIDEYRRIFNDIVEKYDRRSSIDENQIFVIMSYNPKLQDVFREFKNTAKLVNKNLIVKRLDEQRGDYSITDEILENIKKSNLIICDLTEERPNVYYELGYARALNKKIISCAHKSTKLHFDIRNFRTILYSSLSELGDELEKEIRYYYDNTII